MRVCASEAPAEAVGSEHQALHATTELRQIDPLARPRKDHLLDELANIFVVIGLLPQTANELIDRKGKAKAMGN